MKQNQVEGKSDNEEVSNPNDNEFMEVPIDESTWCKWSIIEDLYTSIVF